MPSIIPNPGSPPQVDPTGEIAISGDYTIGAGETYYATDIPTLLRGGSYSTITNNGTVWLDTDRIQVFFIVSSQSDLYNNGTIYLHGEGQVALNNGADRLINTGDIWAISNSGWARVVQAGRLAIVENSGIIAAQTIVSTSASNSGNATAIDSFNGAYVINYETGQILAEAPDLAIAIDSGGSDSDVGPSVTNYGLIQAQATTDAGLAIGIFISQVGPINGQDPWRQATVVNHGTIRAEIAIYGIDASSPRTNPVDHVINMEGGLIDGHILLERGNDIVENNGTIVGIVDLGEGSDTYFGTGFVDGYVDMGWHDDNYEGSDLTDRVAGGRDNDTLAGMGGNDLLFGGFGHDWLSGGTGNDGLYGEWGDDVIVTQGADYVEGGSGNDRVELGDYAFEGVHGGSGFDVLAMASGERDFDLATLAASSRITGFEAIELQGQQELAISASAISQFTGGLNTLWVDATAGDTVHLAGTWARLDDVSYGGTAYQVWEQGSRQVLVTGVTTVLSGSAPSFGGLDAIAGGPTALRPGVEAGLDYTPQATYVHEQTTEHPDLGFNDFQRFVVEAEEIFFTDDRSVFRTSTYLDEFVNYGVLISQNTVTTEAFGLVMIDGSGFSTLFNHGDIIAEATGMDEQYPSVAGEVFAVSAGGNYVENTGVISAYALYANATGVNDANRLNNSGLIEAYSVNGNALGVFTPADFIGTRAFFNTGVIYAEGSDIPDPVSNNTHPVNGAVAVGARGPGNWINDGDIIAVVGENAFQGARSVGLAAYAAGNANQNTVINNGLIAGTIAVYFWHPGANVMENNGLLMGEVWLNNGDDTYDTTLGEARGTVFGFDGNDRFTLGAFDDTIDGGLGLDTAVFDGAFASFTVTETATGQFRVSGAGTDALVGIEQLQFADVTVMLDLGSGIAVDPSLDNPDTFMLNIRDYDGNDLGGGGSWSLIGNADANLDGNTDYIFVNREIGRFAEVSVDAGGLVQFDNFGEGGDTRVVGIYIDPLVLSGEVVAGSDHDSQRRFQNDLFIDNISDVLDSADYDGDGLAEIYFALTDGTAYLHAYMHADGNIQYANYQSEQQVIDYLTANGFSADTWADWFPNDAEEPSDKAEDPTIVGTDDPDQLFGTSGNDVVDARGGDDAIYASPGDDIIDGGEGFDTFNVWMDVNGYFPAATGPEVFTLTAERISSDSGRVDTTFSGIERVFFVSNNHAGVDLDASQFTLAGHSGGVALVAILSSNSNFVGSQHDDTVSVAGPNHDIDGGDGYDTLQFNRLPGSHDPVIVVTSGDTTYVEQNDGLGIHVASATSRNVEAISIYQNTNSFLLELLVDASRSMLDMRFFDGRTDDIFIGGAGDDVFSVTQGFFNEDGTDTYTGNGGANLYLFDVDMFAIDNTVITDFDADDTLDLTSTLYDLTFAGGTELSGVAGEVRYVHDNRNTLVQIDVDGDHAPDATITLAGVTVFLESLDTNRPLSLTVTGDVEINNAVKGTSGNDTIDGTILGDQLFGYDGADSLRGASGNDVIDGGSNIDTAIVGGLRADYVVTQSSTGVFEVSGPDGTDTLTNVEYLQFDDQTIRLLPGTGVSVNFETADPSVYQSAMNSIRDFDGNALGGDGAWLRIGSADVDGDGDIDQILVNDAIGRFATVGGYDDGLAYFDDHGWAGETRVVGTYIDPLVASGDVVEGSDNDSQRRFQNDLEIENINLVLGADDYDGDGLQEVYLALTDGTAYLHLYMHADGNIQYANYQSEQQVIDYLTANGFNSETWADWFPDTVEAEEPKLADPAAAAAPGAPVADLFAHAAQGSRASEFAGHDFQPLAEVFA